MHSRNRITRLLCIFRHAVTEGSWGLLPKIRPPQRNPSILTFNWGCVQVLLLVYGFGLVWFSFYCFVMIGCYFLLYTGVRGVPLRRPLSFADGSTPFGTWNHKRPLNFLGGPILQADLTGTAVWFREVLPLCKETPVIILNFG